MLPDPEKAYDSDPIINSLWGQFLDALRRARRVFVLGHSLNDTMLAQAIRDYGPPQAIAITVLSKEDMRDQIDVTAEPLRDRLRDEFPGAEVIPVRFGEMDVYETAVQAWLQRTTTP
jgi:hypothetical protein